MTLIKFLWTKVLGLHWHEWSKWREAEAQYTGLLINGVETRDVQARTCLSCGKVQVRKYND